MHCNCAADGTYAGGAAFHESAKKAYSTVEAFRCMMEAHTFIPAPHRDAIAQMVCLQLHGMHWLITVVDQDG